MRLLREGEGAEAEDSKGRSSSKDGNGWGGVWVGVFLGWAKTREQKGMYGLERKSEKDMESQFSGISPFASSLSNENACVYPALVSLSSFLSSLRPSMSIALYQAHRNPTSYHHLPLFLRFPFLSSFFLTSYPRPTRLLAIGVGVRESS